jgi:hypothetical protein
MQTLKPPKTANSKSPKDIHEMPVKLPAPRAEKKRHSSTQRNAEEAPKIENQREPERQRSLSRTKENNNHIELHNQIS